MAGSLERLFLEERLRGTGILWYISANVEYGIEK